HRLEIYSLAPARGLPVSRAVFVIGDDKQRAAGDAKLGEERETTVDHGAGNSLAAMALGNRQVIEVSATAVMAAEDGRHKLVAIACDAGQTRIAGEDASEFFGGFRGANSGC